MKSKDLLTYSLAAMSVYKIFADNATSVKNWYKVRKMYHLRMKATDEGFYDVLRALAQDFPEGTDKDLTIWVKESTRRNRYSYGGPQPKTRTVSWVFNGMLVSKIEIQGHKIEVYMTQDKDSKNQQGYELTFRSYSKGARNAVMDWIGQKLQEAAKKGTQTYILDQWDEWHNAEGTGHRELSTVILQEGMKEDLVADITKFLDNEEIYAKMGVHYHRGYLFHGAPGVGKSSLAQALAYHFSLDVYVVSLSDIGSDQSLMKALSQIPSNSVLLLEDMDAFKAAADRKTHDPTTGEVKRGVSIAGLLNALDGILTPYGLITFITTNRPEVLDEGFMRPGRADYIIELGLTDEHMLQSMWDTFIGEGPVPAEMKDLIGKAPAVAMESIRQILMG